ESGKLQTKLIQTNELSKRTQNELNNSSDNESIISESSDIFAISIISNEQDYGFFDSLKTIVPEQSNEWQSYFPNESYADFIKLIINNNLSNSVGDDIIKFFNKHANRIDKPLPSSIQQGKSYIDKTEQTIHDFTNKIVFEFEEKKYLMNYKNIFDGVKELLSKEDIANSSKLLAIILYSDSTTCDKFGKTSKHPIYMTLGNIPM
ncbi:19816_t:CDS:2, partial [Gigaspora margarita]